MRGLGDFQRAQMRDVDPRVAELFGHLRRALDTFEQIMLRPYQRGEQPEREMPIASPPPRAPVLADEQKLTFTVKEIRKLVGISNATLYKILAKGELRAVKVGARTLIRREDLLRWLDKLPPAR